ncbi:MAPEG family protein [Devosia sp. YIM 151766]|uniref:MAPEG family protein n=1 Tax=Devosia sp. YIM 151766 TaxID=3017325 RepID=UPI00255C8789|nr:MAPEG family protein [Devosia sp. YIM 151766]WIY51960.1 MAPEG family protein [Devosia sp. YIM 151766]
MMTIELTLLIWSAVLALAYVAVQSLAALRDYGPDYASSQRDGEPPAGKWAGRGQRALRNFLETYSIFIALAVAVELTGRSDSLTQWGAHIWFWARWAYIPAYFTEVRYLRSGIWALSMLGLVLLFIGVAF